MNNTNEKSHLMYSTLPNIIIGFHGCDQEVFNKYYMSINHLSLVQMNMIG